jgi:hypothetical protein
MHDQVQLITYADRLGGSLPGLVRSLRGCGNRPVTGRVQTTFARQLGDVAGAGPIDQPLELDRTGLVRHVHPRDGDEHQPP